MTPAWITPEDWFDGCANVSRPIRSDSCVRDLAANVSVSLDGGATFSKNAAQIAFGFTRKLKLGFLFTGPVTDFGWTYAHNQGRVALEQRFGGLVDASTCKLSPPPPATPPPPRHPAACC
jgi:hypothetical protein